VEEPDQSLGDLNGGFKSFRIPNSLVFLEEKAGWLHLTENHLTLFVRCLDAFVEETDLAHITWFDIDREFRDLIFDLHVNRARYQGTQERSDRLKQFISDILTALEEFEVLYVIDGFQLEEGPVYIGDVVFYDLDEQSAEKWGIYDSPIKEVADLVGKAVGLVHVRTGSMGKAVEIAKEKIDTALNALRVCLVSFPDYYIHDIQLLQKRGMMYAVKLFDLLPVVLPGWSRGFAPFHLTLKESILESTNQLVNWLKPILDGTVQGRLGLPLLRAVDWIGTSITREHEDDKVADLCTALEAMLIIIDDPKKGEAIALRMMLLAMKMGKAFILPGEIYRLYGFRSRVVHGSARGLCGQSEYLKLRFAVVESLSNVLDFLSVDGSIKRLI